MTALFSSRPIVLCLSGHDATGGAGIQADIETIYQLGGYPCTVVTALTVQNTTNVFRIIPQKSKDLIEQVRIVINDMPPTVIKLGLLGSIGILRAVDRLLTEMDPIPIVLDPILAAGGGKNISSPRFLSEMKTRLIPKVTIMTPNILEARRLSEQEGKEECAHTLLALGCPHILLTGTHDTYRDVVNTWYSISGTKHYAWPRLPYEYHGSGCTLASSLAAYLAQGFSLDEAIQKAQAFTWQALSKSLPLGKGQWLPHRSTVGE